MENNELQQFIDDTRNACEERHDLKQLKYNVNQLDWVNDGIARICNNLYTAHVTAVNLVFDLNTLVEVNFATNFLYRLMWIK